MNHSVKLTVFIISLTLGLVQRQEFCRDFVDLKRRGVDAQMACASQQRSQHDHRICCAYWTTGEQGALVDHSQTYSRQKRGRREIEESHVHKGEKPEQTLLSQKSNTNTTKVRRAPVDIHGIPWNLKTYCCNEYERCCSGTCCLREETCCRDDTGNSTQQCCPAGCCRNSRGEVACCPEFTRQVLTLFAIIFVLYVGVGIKNAVRTYCNIRPVHLDDFNVLDEAHIKKMGYLFC